ncbi:MAG: 1,4-alpha-glucan branching protein GlgB [Bacteroidota bacterium]
MQEKVIPHSLFSDFDVDLFRSGMHYRIHEKLGSKVAKVDGVKGTYFAVWAPNAKSVSVIGSFNFWNDQDHPLNVRWDSSGIWEGFIPHIGAGAVYKYKIVTNQGQHLEKGDPYAFLWEIPPSTASVVWELDYKWKDEKWMKKRKKHNSLESPVSVYEVHMGSWKKKHEDGNRSLSYVEMADELVKHVKELGFTHVEFLPVMEHPFYGSWGYQITGYFATSARFGTPQEFMLLVDKFHQADIGIILDWVPSHFPNDAHGLDKFDGTHLYEHADPRKGYHPDWKSNIFNYGRNEIRSFLISNAIFWLDYYHADGLRVDAVASMLYLDYSRNEGEWEPNHQGGRENLEAIHLLKTFNEEVYKSYDDVLTIAEESTSWPMVSKPTFMGGLGFGMKWMMGWMNDTLDYFAKDPVYRQYHQNNITFSLNYAFSENFMLPLSHDEVVHGKGSLLNKMPGDAWQKFANLRLLYSYMYTHPGTNLLFMGAEIGQWNEWNHDWGLQWELMEHEMHKGVFKLVKDLNKVYKKETALFEKAFVPEGFEWISLDDSQNSILVYIRKGENPKDRLIVVCNFTPSPQPAYRFGVPESDQWKEIFNSDAKAYGGSGIHNKGKIKVKEAVSHGRDHSIEVAIPPLATIILKEA